MPSAARSIVMKRAARSFTVLIAALIILGSPAFGQDPPPQEPAPAGGGGQRGAVQTRPPRPYEQVITRDAKTDKGVFEVHKVGETYYYEIPKTMLGKDFLWVTQIQKNTLGAGFGGSAVGDRVVRWER
jgi:Domain of unknown function (DUF5118)